MRLLHISIIVLCLCSVALPRCLAKAHAQDSVQIRDGFFGGMAHIYHSADFQHLPHTVACCSSFTGGRGTGFRLGALLEIPFNDTWYAGVRVSYMNTPFSMTTTEKTLLTTNGERSRGIFHHQLDGSYSTVDAEPLLMVKPIGDILVSIGAQVSNIIGSSYRQREEVSEANNNATFVNPDGTDSQRRIRNDFSGALPSTTVQVSPVVRIGYDVALNSERSILISPELSYHMGLMNIIRNITWRNSMLYAGVAIRYQKIRDKVRMLWHTNEIDTLIQSVPAVADFITIGKETRSQGSPQDRGDTIYIPTRLQRTDTLFRARPSRLSASITAYSTDANQDKTANATIRVEEFISTTMMPLLGYVFFEPASSEIPARYHRIPSHQTSSFSADVVDNKAKMKTYYHILNIIGKRMQDLRTAKLLLTGCSDESDAEKGNTTLALQRAEAIKQYLVSVWNIEANRITTKGRGLPAKASNTITELGAQENRRVEISSESYEILAPIIQADTVRISNPPSIVFTTTVENEVPLKNWSLSIHQGTKLLKKFAGEKQMPSVISWRVDEDQATMPRTDSPLLYELQLQDSLKSSLTTRHTISLDLLTIRRKRAELREDKEIDRYGLILFDVRSAELTTPNQRIIKFVQTRLKPHSKVRVVGYTDQSGSTQKNEVLSHNRATTTARALSAKNIEIVTMVSNGGDDYNSNLPEGRFYSRRVDIEIETPVEY